MSQQSKYFNCFLFSLLLFSLTVAQPHLAVLPCQSSDLDSGTLSTITNLLSQSIHQEARVYLVPQSEINELLPTGGCADTGCALEIGQELQADQVAYCSLNSLGEKLIIQYVLLDVNTSELLMMDNTTANSIEDLDTVMERIGHSIASHKSYEATAQVGAIAPDEDEKYFTRREARQYSGVSFGYLYPTNGYDDEKRSFTLDYRHGYEMGDWSAGMQVGLRRGFAINIYTDYLLSRTDVCPYVGGAFGFHWVPHEEIVESGDPFSNQDNNTEEKWEDGFELIVHSGLRAFRTYNFQILLNLDYSIAFNDYNDEALVFTIGLLW